MLPLNKKNNNRYIIRTTAVTTIFTLAIMIAAASSMMMATTPTSATATTTTEEATTTTTPEAAGLELSQQPVYRRQITTSQTPINQTHILLTVSGNGTITLPNTTEAINFTGTGSLIASLDGTAAGKEVFTTVDGSEVVNATVFAISRFNMEERTGKGILLLLLQTNSTGRLAPVNGMIVAGQIEYPPEEETALVTVWEWQSGIPLPTATIPEELPPLMNDTTTTTATNASATADTDATAGPPEEEEEGGGEEQQQQPQQQTTPTLPAPNPLFE